jgi:hypothetical protein
MLSKRLARLEAWDRFWSVVLALAVVALLFMVVVDPLKRPPVLGDRGNNEPISLGMN